jgi:transposase-like protein
MFDISDPKFHDKDAAREHLESLRWPDGAVCPRCGGCEKIYAIKPNQDKKIRPGLYKCGDCRRQFTVTVGTLFEGSKMPLNKWLMAVHLMCASKKGISAHQLHRMLGITYKSAWFMAHRIREAMRPDGGGMLGGSGKQVEVDETFGNERKPRSQGKKGRGYHHKSKVLSLVERGGHVRSFHVPSVNAATLKPYLKEQINADSDLITDEASQYTKIGREFAKHDFVSHGIGEYVRGSIHTNTVEGYFSIFKRGLKGSFHHISQKHLKRYLCEFDFRYNHRAALDVSDAQRAEIALRGIEGKRLMYRDSRAAAF